MKLTLERLNMEYLSWAVEFGEGRNKDGIRFGQYIHNKYDVPARIDAFYIEKTTKAYDTILEDLSELESNILWKRFIETQKKVTWQEFVKA